MSQFRYTAAILACLVSLSGCSSLSDPLFTVSGFSGAAGMAAAAGGGGAEAGSSGRVERSAPRATAGAAAIVDGPNAGSGGSATSESIGGSAGEPDNAAGQPSVEHGGQVGPPVVEGACKGKVVAAPALLADFEAGVGGWGGYVGAHFGPLSSTSPGAAQTGHAARFSGGYAETSGMYRELGCADVSRFDGISFYAKGRGADKVRFLAAIPATDPIDDGGDCDENDSVCWDHPGKLFVLSNEWQQYHVAWKDLAQYGWGTKAEFANIVTSLLWINDGQVDSFDFSIDQVKLYKGAPTP